MSELERRSKVELRRLVLDRGHDRGPVVSGVAAPQTRRPVEDRAPLGRVIVHVPGARDEPRLLLEGAIGRERQPERAQVVRDLRALGGRLHGGGGGHWDGLQRSWFAADNGGGAPVCPVSRDQSADSRSSQRRASSLS